jgi:hypothetical protein
MDRRTLFKGAVATAVGLPLASLAWPAQASAADEFVGGYDVAVCEQTTNAVYLHTVDDEDWSVANRKWLWSPPSAVVGGYNTWTDLSDARFRLTTQYGWVALVTASYGKVGIVNAFDDDALLWSARPYGNPHAAERIPDVGVIVVASADPDTSFGGPGNHPTAGFLTVYAPQPGKSDDPSSLTKIDEFTFAGAHGLWYDGTYLWALGSDWLVRYAWEGSSLDFKLKDSGVRFPVVNGHSLDPDFSDSGHLLMTDGSSVRRVDKSAPNGTAPALWTPSAAGVKSYSRVHSGESFLVQARYVSNPEEFTGLTDAYGQWNRYVRFYTSDGVQAIDRTLGYYTSDAHIYKARVSSVDFS